MIRHYPVSLTEASPRYVSYTEIAFTDDWQAIKVMQERDAEIHSLLNTSSYLRLCPDTTPGAKIIWPQLKTDAVGKLRRMLRRALCICDAMYDIEAQSVVAMDLPVPAYRFLPRVTRPLTKDETADWYHFLQSSYRDELQRALCFCKIPSLARNRQFKFIQTLPNADLLALWTLCYLASESFHEWRSTAFHEDLEETTGKERAFKHCILSYGSYFLYGHVRGSGARSRHTASLFNPVIKELTTEDPEEANQLPPGALAALNNTLMKRLDVGIRDVDDKALDRLVNVLGVERKVFDNPPSTTVWGA